MSQVRSGSLIRDPTVRAMVRALGLSTSAFLFGYILVSTLFVEITAEKATKVIKMLSLIFLNVFTSRVVGDIVSELNRGLKVYLQNWYAFVRFYVWIAVFVVFLSLLPDECIEAAGVGKVPWWIRVYIVNGLAVFPVALYTIANWFCLRTLRGATEPADSGNEKEQRRAEVQRHLEDFLYLVDFPSVVSIIAFVLALVALQISDRAAEATFIGGASALLMFLTSSMTVCVDQHALHAYYHRFTDPGGGERRLDYFVVGGVLLAIGLATLYLEARGAGLSTGQLGTLLLFVGLCQVVHAFWAKGWGGFVPSLCVGLVWIVGGLLLLRNPEALGPFAGRVVAVGLLVSPGVFLVWVALRSRGGVVAAGSGKS